MPTPRPIIIPRVGANSGTSATLLSIVMPAAPRPTPTRAAPIVAPMATTEPTAMISTNTAKARPMASDWGGTRSESQAPPTSTWTPSTERSPRASIRSLISPPISADSSALVPISRFTSA